MSKRAVYQLVVLHKLFHDLLEKFFSKENDPTSMSYNKWFYFLSNKILRIYKKQPRLRIQPTHVWRRFDRLTDSGWAYAYDQWITIDEVFSSVHLGEQMERHARLGAKEYRWSKSEQKVLSDCARFIYGASQDPSRNLSDLAWINSLLSPVDHREPEPLGRASEDAGAEPSTASRRPGSKPHLEQFATPAGTRWGDVTIKFKDGETASIRVREKTGVYNYTQMGMCNRKNGGPTCQWSLLRTLAENHGLLTWDRPGASRKNPKRRERLSGDLRRFFGIKDDPFMLTHDRKGWQARFGIADD
jgi:hypothetical protein